MSASWLLISATVALVALIDFVPRLFTKPSVRRVTLKKQGRIPDFLIMPTVYGDISYLKNASFLKKYSNRVLICTSDHETPQFYKDLRKVCRTYGFRYTKAEVPVVKGRPVKNAYTIYKGAFKNLKKLKARVDLPCILIDADTYTTDNVNTLVRSFVKSNAHIASLRCEVANPKTLFEVLQAFEYKVAMDNRNMDPWLTSGACNVATAGIYRSVFKQHSNFFAGGDIEIGKIASVMGYRVKYIPFTFFTEAPNNFKDWYAQRITWYAGGIRHHVVNIGSFGWYHFFMLFYNSALIYLLLPLRWVEFINYPLTLFLLLGISWFYTFILLAGRTWRPAYLLLPFYSFFQTMWVIPRAFGRYLNIAWSQRSLGLLRYDFSKKARRTRAAFLSLNIASAAVVIIFVASFSYARMSYWMNNERGYMTRAIHLISKN